MMKNRVMDFVVLVVVAPVMMYCVVKWMSEPVKV